ncbi:conserved Plasmodium protein, unknown function [Plasmodium vivax]|nr:conserved Plasmodium protein, unknown function [Plasmodium vivax]
MNQPHCVHRQMNEKMTQIGSPQKDPNLNTVIRPPLKIAQGGKDKRGGVPFLVSSKNGDIQKNSEDGKKKTGHLEQCQEQEVIQEQEVFQERVGVPPRDEREKYNEFFEAKMYLPPLRASKRELNFFFKILSNAMEKNNKSNIYISLMDILCKNFPSYIGLFAHLWFQCKVLLAEKLILIEFFRQLKINSEIINHFFNYGYDSFETILSITPQDLANVQEFNKVTWLPGHTFRLKMIFSQIEKYFNLFIQQNDDYVQKIKKFILSKRRRTELTLQLSLERQQNDRGQCPMYGPHVGNNTNLPLPPEGTQDVNIITYQQYVSPNWRSKNFSYNPTAGNSLYEDKTLLKNYSCSPYPVLRSLQDFFSLRC